jgi:hypothetical protein
MVSFSVAANPTSVRITGAVKEQVVDTGLVPDAYDFAWGAKHTVQVVSDSGETADLDKVGVMRLRFKLPGSSGAFVDSQARSSPVIAASQHNMVRSAWYKQVPKAGNTEDQAKAIAIQAFKDDIDKAISAGVAQSVLPYNGYYVFNDARTNSDGADVPPWMVPVVWDTLPNSGFWGQLSASKTGTTYNLKVEMSSRGTIKDQNGTVVATPGGATVSVPTTTVPLPPPPGF